MTNPVLYVWKEPRPADAAAAAALVEEWLAGDAGDIHRGPFAASDDVSWFNREITGDAPPIWNPDKPARDPDPPDRVVVVPLQIEPLGALPEQLEDIYGLAAKYDLVVYDPQRQSVHVPLAELLAHESATFWPGGAMRAARAGLIGAVIAIGAYVIGIPIVSGIAIVIGLFLVVLSIGTFVHEGRARSGRN